MVTPVGTQLKGLLLVLLKTLYERSPFLASHASATLLVVVVSRALSSRSELREQGGPL